MQLRLTRYDLLITLLVFSFIHVEASRESLRVTTLTPSPKAMRFQQESSYDTLSKNDKGFESKKISKADVKTINDDENQRRRDVWNNSDGNTFSMMYSNPNQPTMLLAEKLAHEVLHSKKTQDTINKLSSLKNEPKKSKEVAKKIEKIGKTISTTTTSTTISAATSAATPIQTTIQTTVPTIDETEETKRTTTVKSKAHAKHKPHSDKHKHKEHRKHHHPKRRLTRRYSKKDFSKTARKRKIGTNELNVSSNSGRMKRKCNSENSVNCRRRKRNNNNNEGEKKKFGGKKSQSFINNNNNNNNYVNNINNNNSIEDQLQKFDSNGREYRKLIPVLKRNDNDIENLKIIDKKRSHVIAKLMQTTTRDPNKKKPGDQGVEYSEYYSDDENILLPEIKDVATGGTGKVGGGGGGGQVRSVREAEENDGIILEPDYNYDLENDRQFREDVDRLKRNDEKSLRIMQVPSNSMEYIDNTYQPEIANGVINNAKMSRYPGSYNLNYDGMMRNYPSEEESLNKNRENYAISSIGNFDRQSQRPGFFGNSESPRFADGNFPHYSLGSMPSPMTTSPRTTPGSFSRMAKGDTMMKFNAGRNSSLSNFAPFTPPSYENARENNRIFAYGETTAGKARSVVRVTPKPIYSTPGGTQASPSFNSFEFSSRLREPEIKYSNYNDGVENIRGEIPAQIESIASRETGRQGTTVKTECTAHCNSTKTESSISTTATPASSSTASNSSSNNSTTTVDAKKQTIGNATTLVTRNSISTTTSSSVSSTTGTTVASQVNKTAGGNNTKAVASEILSEIIGELEELRLENPQNEQREGLPCKLTGSWVTARAGVRIDMNVTSHTVKVSLDHLTPPITTEGLLNVTWNVTGYAPFKRGGPFTLIATNNHTKTLAVFVGACKVCQGIDTIEGSWTVSKEPRDCRDFQMSINMFNEIFRRTRLFSAIKDKQQSKPDSRSSGNTSNSTTGDIIPNSSISRDSLDNSGRLLNNSLTFIGIE